MGLPQAREPAAGLDGPSTSTVVLRVCDSFNECDTSSTAVRIDNAPPAVEEDGTAFNFSGQTHVLSVDFTDPGTPDTHTAVINWGDGDIESGTVSEAGGAGSVSGSHQYFVPGDYTITVTVTDDDGDSATHTLVKTVVRMPVAINIKPGSDPNSINVKSLVPVAILTTSAGELGLPESFDATDVDVSTVRFGPIEVLDAGAGGSEVHGRGHIEDSQEPDELTNDGDLDLVLHFRASESGIVQTTTTACVQGLTVGGVYFTGCDSVRIPPGSRNPRNSSGGKPAGIWGGNDR